MVHVGRQWNGADREKVDSGAGRVDDKTVAMLMSEPEQDIAKGRSELLLHFLAQYPPHKDVSPRRAFRDDLACFEHNSRSSVGLGRPRRRRVVKRTLKKRLTYRSSSEPYLPK